MMDWIDEYIRDYDERVYAGLMSPRAKSVLRAMKMREHEDWMDEESRVDNNTGHDDQ